MTKKIKKQRNQVRIEKKNAKKIRAKLRFQGRFFLTKKIKKQQNQVRIEKKKKKKKQPNSNLRRNMF